MIRFIRVALEATKRTDLVCACCFGFFTEFAIVPPGRTEQNAYVGVHRRCVKALHHRRTRKAETS